MTLTLDFATLGIVYLNESIEFMTVATDKVRVSTYIQEDLKPDLEALAKVQKRSLSNLLEVLCQEAVDKAKKDGLIA